MIYSFERNDFAKYTSKEEFAKIVDLKTVPELLDHLKNNYLGLAAIGKRDDTTATYDDLLNDINKVCAYLKEQGVKKGANIGILFDNSYEFAVFSLGVMAYGAVAVLLPMQLDEKIIFGCSKKYALNGLFYLSAFQGKVALLNPNELMLANESVLANSYEGCFIDKDIKENDAACIIMTGGTTGKSKGAVLSHTALMCGMINGCYGLSNFMHLTYYSMMPLTHVFGFIRNLLTSLYTGSVIYFNHDRMKMFEDMKKYAPSILVIVPALAEIFLNLAKAYGLGFLGGKVKHIICGAAPVSSYLVLGFNNLGVNFCPGYGLTEFANMVSGNPDGIHYPSSVGMLFPDQEAKIVDGELLLRGRNMLLSYYNEPEENKTAFVDGWFKTGDLARFDENKNLYIIGRSKDVIILANGENVSPAYIETKVNELPFIQDSLVTEDVNDLGAQILKVEVVLRAAVVNSLGKSQEELTKFVTSEILKLNDNLQDFERLSKVVIRDKDFERSPAMKIIRPKKVYNE